MTLNTVAVLGATSKADRYAFLAMQRLQNKGYRVIPVNPAFPEVLGERCYSSLAEIQEPIDTLTMYIGAARSEPLVDQILKARPRRIIFNPGSENEHLELAAAQSGIEIIHGCTLVMLATDAF